MSASTERTSTTATGDSADFVKVETSDSRGDAGTAAEDSVAHVVVKASGTVVTYTVEQIREAQLRDQIRKLLGR